MDSKVIKHIYKLVPALIVAIIVMFNGAVYAQQSLYLLNPSRADLIQLAEASAEIYAPIAVPFVFNPYTTEYYMGIPVSNKIRNGVHGRLLVENGLVDSLADAKSSNHGYEAGTLFLELDPKGNPYFSVHLRNSFISTINDNKVRYNRRGSRSNRSGLSKISPKLFQKISNDFQLPIEKSSISLFNKINTITAEKYSIKLVKNYFKDVNTKYLFSGPIFPNSNEGVAESRNSSPELVEVILDKKAEMKELKNFKNLKIKIGLSLSQIMCKSLFK